MKKLLLTLGTVAAVAAPVAAVVACGSNPDATPGTTDGFKTATIDQANALGALAIAIENEPTVQGGLGIESDQHLAKTEIKGTDVRFTYGTTTDGNPRVITVSLATSKITKVESLLNGELHDNTSSITAIDAINASLSTDIKSAAAELAKVDHPTSTTADANSVDSLVTEGVLESRPTPSADHTTTDIVDAATKAKVLAEIAGLKFEGKTTETNGDVRYFYSGSTTTLSTLADGSQSTTNYAVRMDDRSLTPAQESKISAVLTINKVPADATAWAAEGSAGTKLVVAGLDVLDNHKITNVVSWIK